MCRLRTLALAVIAPTLLAATLVADGADKLAPKVRITRPADGAIVTSYIYVDVAYQSVSGQPIVRIDLFIDGIRRSNVSVANPRLNGVYSFRWDTAAVSNDIHSVQAQVYDAGGHNGVAKIRVYVKNETPTPGGAAPPPAARDAIPPTVQVTSPQNGAVVSDRIEIGIEATDESGVDYVVFYLDDKFLHLTNQAPYRFLLDTKRLADGIHTTQGVGFDPASNKGESAKVYFTVQNYAATGSAPPERAAADAVLPVIGAGKAKPNETIVAPPAPEPKVARAPVAAGALAALAATDRAASSLTVQPHSELASAAIPTVPMAPALRVRTSVPSAVANVPIRATQPASRTSSPTARAERTPGTQIATPPSRASGPQGTRVAYAPTAAPADTANATYPPRELGVVRVTAPRAPAAAAMALADAPRSHFEAVIAGQAIEIPSADAIVSGNGPRTTMPMRVAAGSLPSKPLASRGDMYAMLPQAMDTSAVPERTAATTPAGQRMTEPAEALGGLTHIAHVAGKEYRIIFNGDLLKLRTPPDVKAGISISPFREVFEHTGGVVHWYPVGKRVEARNDSTWVKLRIGDPEALVNEASRTLSPAPYSEHGRTMVPLSFIKDILNVTVEFNPQTGAILITSNEF
jgi:hypothetical protein